jgi:UDP-N-acetyl-D-mannosaminuronate dehydrogenase
VRKLESQKNDIFSWNQTIIQEKLKNGEIHVCVIGIGRIGLPTAISFVKANLPTIGVAILANVRRYNVKEGKISFRIDDSAIAR